MKKKTVSMASILALVASCGPAFAGTYLGVDFEKDNLSTIQERFNEEGKRFTVETVSSFNHKPISQAITLVDSESLSPLNVLAQKQILLNGYGEVIAVGYLPTALETSDIMLLHSIISHAFEVLSESDDDVVSNDDIGLILERVSKSLDHTFSDDENHPMWLIEENLSKHYKYSSGQTAYEVLNDSKT